MYKMEYYSAIKKNAFESVLIRWMKLEPIIQSEVSQKEKHQYSIVTMETERRGGTWYVLWALWRMRRETKRNTMVYLTENNQANSVSIY